MNYPDFTKPLQQMTENNYPDLSQPITDNFKQPEKKQLSNVPGQSTVTNDDYSPSMLSSSSALQYGGAESMKYNPGLTQLGLSLPFAGFGTGPGIANALTRIGVGSGLGTAFAQSNPGNQNSLASNAAFNTLGNAAIESIPAIGKGLSYLQPDKYANQIYQHLTSGLDPASNARVLGTKIKNAYDLVKDKSKQLYSEVFDAPNINNGSTSNNLRPSRVGDARIDQDTDVFGQVVPRFVKTFTPDIEDAHNAYLANSTLDNAHNLQSKLGLEERRLKSMNDAKNLSTEDNNIYQGYTRTRKALQSDIDSTLNKIDPTLTNKYADASNHYFNEIAPYLQNPAITKIVKSPIDKLSGKSYANLHKEFVDPGEDMQTILGHMGGSANQNILAAALGPNSGEINAEGLRNKIKTINEKGYGQYLPQEFNSLIQNLGKKEKFKKYAQTIPSAAIALANLHPGASLLQNALVPSLYGAGMYGISKLGENIFNKIPTNSLNKLAPYTRTAARTGINSLNN
jgi:hypothetical protein